MSNITLALLERYQPVQPSKAIIHAIRCELSKYNKISNLEYLENFEIYFKKQLSDILIRYDVYMSDKYIWVDGYFEGTKMTWRTDRNAEYI